MMYRMKAINRSSCLNWFEQWEKQYAPARKAKEPSKANLGSLHCGLIGKLTHV